MVSEVGKPHSMNPILLRLFLPEESRPEHPLQKDEEHQDEADADVSDKRLEVDGGADPVVGAVVDVEHDHALRHHEEPEVPHGLRSLVEGEIFEDDRAQKHKGDDVDLLRADDIESDVSENR